MKAIHNPLAIDETAVIVGNYKLKYNFESNSQQGNRTSLTTNGWEL
nr:hypothetical protein [Flavobacterium franklandianum]